LSAPPPPSGTPSAQGIAFGPTASGKMYVSLFAHRGANPAKSCSTASTPPHAEYGIFNESDRRAWHDTSGHYWGVQDGGRTIIGTRGERLAKFPRTAIPSPWHGFPVSPYARGSVDAPPDDFVEAWIESGAVSKTIGGKIERRKI
jgi:hypothetical protein